MYTFLYAEILLAHIYELLTPEELQQENIPIMGSLHIQYLQILDRNSLSDSHLGIKYLKFLKGCGKHLSI